VSWIVVLTFLQLSLYPSLKKTFDSYAFPASFGASLLLFTLISWYCGLVYIPIPLALLPFVILFVYHLYRRHYTIGDLRSQWRWELVFLIFFFLMLEVRFVNPTISYAEKFMDHAFLASVMRQPVVPPLDPWFSGGFLNVYYYLGYWMFGCLAIVSGVPSNIAFNLALPTVLAVSAVTLYAIGDLLLERFRWLPLLTLLLPNPAMVHQLIFGTAVNPAYDPSLTWLGTRAITNTINEYPLFSFIWGDVHPHVISMFNQLLLIFILVYAWKRWGSLDKNTKQVLCIIAALSLGSMPLINTWDVLIYAPITVIVSVLILLKHRPVQFRPDAILLLISLPVLSVIIYLPFYLQLDTYTSGFGLIGPALDSDLVYFLYVHAFFLIIITATVVRDIVRRPWFLVVPLALGLIGGYESAAIATIPLIYLIVKKDLRIHEILAIFGLFIVIASEFIYIKDYMGDINFRMNTIFKWYMVAWLLLSISVFTTIGQVLSHWNRVPKISARQQATVVIVIVSLLAAAPLLVPLDLFKYGSRSLDGLAYLDTYHPGDAAAVAYLRSLQGGEIIVEAQNGGSYSYYSRISSFTGLQTIIGWTGPHEWGWRSKNNQWYVDNIASRIKDIQTIYEQPEQMRALMQKYNATYLVVGEPERTQYKVSLPSSGLELVLSQDGTDIYKLVG